MERHFHRKLLISLMAFLFAAGSMEAQKPRHHKHNKKDKVSLTTDYFAEKLPADDLIFNAAMNKKPGKRASRKPFFKQRSEALNNVKRKRQELPKMKHGRRHHTPEEIAPSR